MRVLIIVLLLGHSFAARCQKCVVANRGKNIVYVGISNLLEIAVEGHYCKDIVLSTNDGKLEQFENPGNYLFYPDKPGNAELVVSDISGAESKVISKVVFFAEKIDPPEVFIAGENGGEISKKKLVAQIAPYAKLIGHPELEAVFPIEGFRATIFRGEEVVFTKKCIGRRFSDAIIDAFQRLETNDKLIISDIKYRRQDMSHGTLKPIELSIVD